MRYAAKRDSEEKAFVDLLEAAGCAVQRWSQAECPDLVVSWPQYPPPTNQALHAWTGRIALAEVKTEKRKLQPGQVEFRKKFPCWELRTVADVEALLRWLKTL